MLSEPHFFPFRIGLACSFKCIPVHRRDFTSAIKVLLASSTQMRLKVLSLLSTFLGPVRPWGRNILMCSFSWTSAISGPFYTNVWTLGNLMECWFSFESGSSGSTFTLMVIISSFFSSSFARESSSCGTKKRIAGVKFNLFSPWCGFFPPFANAAMGFHALLR